MLYFSNISLIFQLCLYYLAIYTYKAKLKKKQTKPTFLQRNFYPQLLSFTENLMQTVFYWWEGTASSWLVGWSVCGCLPLYINTWWSDLSPLHPCMHTYSEGELDSLVSVTLGKPWFVTDRHLMLQTDLAFLCLSILATLYPLTP